MEDKLIFEKEMNRIDEIIRLLSGGQEPLEQSLELYKESLEHFRNCRTMLDEAELKIIEISKVLHEEVEA